MCCQLTILHSMIITLTEAATIATTTKPKRKRKNSSYQSKSLFYLILCLTILQVCTLLPFYYVDNDYNDHLQFHYERNMIIGISSSSSINSSPISIRNNDSNSSNNYGSTVLLMAKVAATFIPITVRRNNTINIDWVQYYIDLKEVRKNTTYTGYHYIKKLHRCTPLKVSSLANNNIANSWWNLQLLPTRTSTSSSGAADISTSSTNIGFDDVVVE